MHTPNTALPLPPITTPADLAAVVAGFEPHAKLALDTEFLRERTYLAELALVQISDGRQIALIDPLADISLDPLAQLLIDPTRTKVLHAARQDIEVLLPLTISPLAPIFDTQIAAALLGMPAQIGYADLVLRELNVTLEKSQTRTDWTKRPLSEAQLHYAADDVRWLLPLAERLEEQLNKHGRLAWLVEDCTALINPAIYRMNPTDAWQRLKGIQSLPPSEQQRLRALATWREARAQRRNLPRSWVVTDDAIRAIAQRVPTDLAGLQRLAIMPVGASEKFWPEIKEALSQAAEQPLNGITQTVDVNPSPEDQAATKRLAERMRSVAQSLNLLPEVLGTQRDLRRIASGEPPLTVLSGWRADILAAPLAQALAGS